MSSQSESNPNPRRETPPEPIDWDRDLPPATAEEEYAALKASLRRNRGFGLLFAQCSPAQANQLIERVGEDLPQKRMGVLKLDSATQNVYEAVRQFLGEKDVEILFVTGLELSLYAYEDQKRKEGWQSDRVYGYSWEGVPPVLRNLNQQRDRFRDNFDTGLVFLLPRFAVDYLIHRAPDFFDWRSGVFELPMDAEALQRESTRIVVEGDYGKYCTWTQAERYKKLIEIQALLEEAGQTEARKAQLWFERGLLLAAAREYEKAILSWDKALEFKPDYHEAWNNRGNALFNLGRYEEAINSFERALEIKLDYDAAWYNRGIALGNLGRYEEAINSYDKALEIKPDKDAAWNHRGIALGNLGRYEEAITSFDKALEIKPDYDAAWYNRGIALDDLGRYEEAITSYDKALQFKPEDDAAWNNRGIALFNLGRYEEAITSYDKALEFKPDKDEAWYNKACCYGLQNQADLAIENLQRAIELAPEKNRDMARTDSDFDSIRHDPRFQALLS